MGVYGEELQQEDRSGKVLGCIGTHNYHVPFPLSDMYKYNFAFVVELHRIFSLVSRGPILLLW